MLRRKRENKNQEACEQSNTPQDGLESMQYSNPCSWSMGGCVISSGLISAISTNPQKLQKPKQGGGKRTKKKPTFLSSSKKNQDGVFPTAKRMRNQAAREKGGLGRKAAELPPKAERKCRCKQRHRRWDEGKEEKWARRVEKSLSSLAEKGKEDWTGYRKRLLCHPPKLTSPVLSSSLLFMLSDLCITLPSGLLWKSARWYFCDWNAHHLQ